MKTRFIIRCGAAALALAALGSYAADTYRWVDESGRTHFSDTVPERYRDTARKIEERFPEPTDAQRREAEARAAKEKEAGSLPGSRPLAVPPLLREAPRSSATPERALAAAGGEQCELLFGRYRESQECFARFRLAGGGVSTQAFLQCPEVLDPAPRCGIRSTSE